MVSPDFGKEFFLYTFASDVSYATILTQKEKKGNEVPISYMSSNLQGAELNYPNVEKQGYAVFKVVKHFRPYLLKERTKVIVPHPTIRALFVQKEMGERRGNWITALQEFDLEIKPASGAGTLQASNRSLGRQRRGVRRTRNVEHAIGTNGTQVGALMD